MLAEGKNVDNFTVGGFDMNYGWDFKDSIVHVFRDGRPASNLIKADSAEYAQLPAGNLERIVITGTSGGGDQAEKAEVKKPVIKQKKPGPNDPCWCGSGKKYKKCHMMEDIQNGEN